MADYAGQANAIYVTLTGGVMLVDAEYVHLFSSHKWRVDRRGYACRNVFLGKVNGKQKFKNQYAHRLIMGNPGGMVDHVNGNRLDNSRINLRVTDNSHNKANGKIYRTNRTGYKGVTSRGTRFVATITKGDQTGAIHLGSFSTAEEAALAYDRAATQRWGRFARLNKVEV